MAGANEPVAEREWHALYPHQRVTYLFALAFKRRGDEVMAAELRAIASNVGPDRGATGPRCPREEWRR